MRFPVSRFPVKQGNRETVSHFRETGKHKFGTLVLELCGREFNAVNQRKPEKLSDVISIIQKRIDLKKNQKQLEPKATMEFLSNDPIVKFSEDYVSFSTFAILIDLSFRFSQRKVRNRRDSILRRWVMRSCSK